MGGGLASVVTMDGGAASLPRPDSPAQRSPEHDQLRLRGSAVAVVVSTTSTAMDALEEIATSLTWLLSRMGGACHSHDPDALRLRRWVPRCSSSWPSSQDRLGSSAWRFDGLWPSQMRQSEDGILDLGRTYGADSYNYYLLQLCGRHVSSPRYQIPKVAASRASFTQGRRGAPLRTLSPQSTPGPVK